GQTASFTAAATGTPAPTVQWQVLAANGGTSYVNIPGATSTTYSFTAIAANSGNLYRAVFTNALGQVDTNPATLTISPAATVVIPSAKSLPLDVPTQPIQAATVTGPAVVRLSGSAKPVTLISPNDSGLMVLHPAAVAVVLTERLE